MVKVYLAVKRRDPARRQDGGAARQQGSHLDDRSGRGHAVHERRHAGRHRPQPPRSSVANECRSGARGPSRMGGEGARPHGVAHAGELRISRPGCADFCRRCMQLKDKEDPVGGLRDDELRELAGNLRGRSSHGDPRVRRRQRVGDQESARARGPSARWSDAAFRRPDRRVRSTGRSPSDTCT